MNSLVTKKFASLMASLIAASWLLAPVQARSFYDKMLFHPRTNFRFNPDQIDNVPKREVNFKTPDGARLHGWYFDAPDSDKVALISEGNGGNMGFLIPLAQLLLQCKCSVMLYDYEGYGESEGHPTLNRVVADGLAAYDYMDKNFASNKKKILVGVSLGTGVTCQIAKQRQADAIVLSSPFTSLLNMARQKNTFIRYTPSLALPRQHLDNVAVLKRAHPPVLILHGTSDTLIPVSESEKLFAAASEPKTLVKLEGAGHNNAFTQTKSEYLSALHTFLDDIN